MNTTTATIIQQRLRTLLLMLVAATAFIPVHAQLIYDWSREGDEVRDTVYLFQSWDGIMDLEADAMLINPLMLAYTPYDIEIRGDDKESKDLITNQSIAALVNDSIWLINSKYLQKHFKGDAKKLDDYVPLFYNDKVAFAVWIGYSTAKQILGGLLGDSEMFDNDPYTDPADYYYIDFDLMRVDKVDAKTLSSLLSDYPDLQMRYEGMKDYKEGYVIEDYFLQYIDRVTQDPTKPYILELINPAPPIE